MSWNIPDFLEKKGEDRPTVDLLLLAIGLAVFSGLSFWVAFLTQLAGPAVENGINPQRIASLQWSAVGIVLGVLAVFVYQRRPIGWYGTFAAAMVGVIQAVRVGVASGAFWIPIMYLIIPLVVATLLLFRRDRFLDQ